ncbi:diguanylate cyclase [Desulfocurvus vexinensis]|uniref:diguanylate cyclase n=1 Tax=Desulfocurvus vexinensis TaxID=399548 RepID=UPI00048DCA75|nr:diguanylate cyclase [Desulfocurvus vexinensis]
MSSGTERLLASVRQGLEQVFPPVTAQLMRELVKPHPDFEDIARVIGLDPVLSAAALTLVNSPFYSLSQKVTTLERAAVVLGTKEILKIALSVSFAGKGLAGDKSEANFANWRLVVWSAIAAELLAERLCPGEADLAYLCALLKDLSLLLVARTAPDMLPYGGDAEVLTCLRPGQMDAEARAWGLTHPQLTLRALADWGVPDLGGGCIAHHHDTEAVDSLPPLAQAVTLATQWAELAAGCDRDPILLVQFEMLLRERLGASTADVEQMRAVCIQKYRSMLAILDLEEAAPAARLYEHSIQAMQNYHFQTMEITATSGGTPSVARIVGRHLRWNFGLTEWDLALRAPRDDGWDLLLAKDGTLEEGGHAALDEGLPWRFTKRRLLLLASGEKWGELRLKAGTLAKEAEQDMNLFLRFLSRAYEQYCLRHAVLEAKADTLDALPVGVARLDEDGRVLELNPALYAFLGQPKNPLGRDVMECMALLDVPSVDTEWRLFLGNPDRPTFSKIYCSDPGQPGAPPRCMYFSAHKESRAGRTSVLFLAEDVTEVSAVEAQALRQGAFMEQLVGSMQDMVMTVDAAGTITFASPRYSDRLTGRNLFAVAKPVGSFAGTWGPAMLDDEAPSAEIILQLRDGTFKSLELMVSRLRGTRATSPAYLVVGRDLTSVRRLEERLKRQALFDSLTELFNRFQFHAFLEREARRATRTGRPMGMVFFDLDGFKDINDTRGHQAGDEVLKDVAAIVRDTVRKGTDLPCRYGGDEFAIIATDSKPEGLRVLAQRLRDAIVARYGPELGVSLGLATLLDGENPDDLVRRADRACYRAKARGGNAIVEAGEP